MDISKRLTIKGEIDYDSGTVTVYDKKLGELTYTLEEIFREFHGLDDVVLTLSHRRDLKA